jgi:hypothetical protein
MNVSPSLAAELSQPELCAQLRIIAADAPRLSVADRSLLNTAASELEIVYRQLLLDNVALSEALSASQALRDRVAELTNKGAWSYGASVVIGGTSV